MSDPIHLPPEFIARMKLDREMSNHTRDEMVKEIWSSAEEGQTHAFFVLDAHIQWNTEQPRWQKLPLGEVAPDHYDPPGSGPKRWMPGPPSHHACRVPIPALKKADVPKSHGDLVEAIRQAQVIADALSLVSQAPVRLRTARRVQMGWDERMSPPGEFEIKGSGKTYAFVASQTAQESTSTVVDDLWIDERLRRFLTILTNIPDADVRSTLENAINWHAQANSLEGLGRYVHYWASIELLGSFFYEFLDATYLGRKTASAIELDIVRKLLDINSRNYAALVDECSKMLNPSSREKILALSKLVVPSSDKLRRALYEKVTLEKGKPPPDARSMYDIRNDIAHGNISGLMRSYLETNMSLFERFQSVSGEFIVSVLNKSQLLCQHRRADYVPGGVATSD